jgi:hypothetical protein
MNISSHSLFLSFLFITGICIAQQKTGWLKWENSAGNISISYPKEWTELKLNSADIVVAFAAPKDNAKDRDADMMVLRVFPDSGAKSIDQLKDFARKSLNTKWKYKINLNKKIETKDRSYIKSVAEDTENKIILIMYTMLAQDRIFFFTLFTEKKNYEKYMLLGDEAFNSLVIGMMPLPK